jgi:hypothetical protein
MNLRLAEILHPVREGSGRNACPPNAENTQVLHHENTWLGAQHSCLQHLPIWHSLHTSNVESTWGVENVEATGKNIAEEKGPWLCI